MTNLRHVDILEDIIDAIDKAQYFIKGLEQHQFTEDEKTQFARIRALEIIGEAANKFPKSFHKNHPNIPWQEIIGMRNKLIHDYMGVNAQVVWKTILEDLPELRNQIQIILRKL
jgi:uncharacterized protein with HEPN domain